ncbi:MAG: 50S ribosome-binding GTPase, partial [Acidimicrobiia bacterium]|nr:50S ribosome-binding GTPase [Acidimicrobiia bacterium]
MPTNVTPEFRKVQKQYRKVREPAERLALLKEMLRLIPKHKGTEHLQAEMRTKMKELTDELSGPARGGTRTGPQVAFRPEGAGQVVLVGPPNSGKSALHDRLTGSHAASEAYPFASQFPVPGMFRHGDVAFQLIDVPSLGTEHPVPYVGNTVQHASGCLLVVDLSAPDCVSRTRASIDLLAEKKVDLIADWSGGDDLEADASDDFFRLALPTLLVANKADLIEDPMAELEVLEELIDVSYPTIAVSAVTGFGLDELGSWLFDQLQVVRVYTKIPGHHPDTENPFTLHHGDTVIDLAELIHKD